MNTVYGYTCVLKGQMKTFPVNMKFIKPGASVRATVCRYTSAQSNYSLCMMKCTLYSLKFML